MAPSIRPTVLIGRDPLAIGQLMVTAHGTVLRRTGLADKPCFEDFAHGVLAGAGGRGRNLRLALQKAKDKLGLSLPFMPANASNPAQPAVAFPDWAGRWRASVCRFAGTRLPLFSRLNPRGR
jgi:hypothetical protein